MQFALLAALLAVFALAPATASAQDGGVHVDPDSPTGQEYALPLESARRKAAGQESEFVGNGAPSTPAPLFGEGIEPDAARSSGRARRADKGEAGRNGSKARERDRATPARISPAVEAAIHNPGAPDGGVGGMLLYGLVALAIVGLGAAAGAAIRRRS